MSKTKFTALILAISFIMSCVTVFAEDVNETNIYIVAPKTAEVGDSITVGVNLTECLIAGGEFALNYDNSLLKVVSGVNGDEFKATGASSVINTKYADNKCFFTFANAENINFNGCLAEFTFEVIKNENAEFNFSTVSFSDYDLNDLTIMEKGSTTKIGQEISTEITTEVSTEETTSETSTFFSECDTETTTGKITNSETSTESTTAILSSIYVIAPKTANVDNTITVSINLTDCVIAGGEFALEYDSSLLKIVSGVNGDEFKATGASSVINTKYADNKCFFTFANAENINFNGCLAEFTFEVIDSGNAEFNFSTVSFSDYDLKDLVLNEQGCTIQLVSGTTETSTEVSTEVNTEITTEVSTETTFEADTETSTETNTETSTNNAISSNAVKVERIGENDLNFVAGINNLDYKEVGFILEANEKTVVRNTKTVYSTIEDSSVSKNDLNSEYLFAFTITDINDVDAVIKVTPYVIDFNGKYITFESVICSLSDFDSGIETLSDGKTSDTDFVESDLLSDDDISDGMSSVDSIGSDSAIYIQDSLNDDSEILNNEGDDLPLLVDSKKEVFYIDDGEGAV